MGNRAVITFSTDPSAPCIYLHWNGGRASVEGFLRAAHSLGITLDSRRVDSLAAQAETMDALAEFIARDFFNCSVGRTVYREYYGQADKNNGNNGVYRIDRELNIVGRSHMKNKSSDDFIRHVEEHNPEKTEAIYGSLILANAIGW